MVQSERGRAIEKAVEAVLPLRAGRSGPEGPPAPACDQGATTSGVAEARQLLVSLASGTAPVLSAHASKV